MGYMKKFCGENNKMGIFFGPPTFAMRFCALDLSLMTFRYAKSPKEKFTEMKMDEITYAGPVDTSGRKKPIKVKDAYDLKYLIYIMCDKR